MKTLYVSDLDGTLMQPDATISPEAATMLNEAISDGKLFTIATARTPATVAGILQDVRLELPAIVMTGAALWDTRTGHYSRKCYFSPEAAQRVVDTYRSTHTATFLFTLKQDMIDIYHIGGELLPLHREFMEERIHSPFKLFHIDSSGGDTLPADLSEVILLYSMLPDGKAASTYSLTKEIPGVRAQYYHDIFGPEVGILEAFSDTATKANAVKALAASIGAERIICFGDNINDLPMMAVADVAVAVDNALPEVKAAADIIIGPNTSDAVARFILDHD